MPPDFFPKALFDSLGTVTGAPLSSVFRKDIVGVAFRLGTPLAVRQAIIDSIGGVVVGGSRSQFVEDGTYYVQIHGGTTAALLAALTILHRQPAVAMATWWEHTRPDENAYRRPTAVPAHAPTSISSALWDSLTAPANLMTDPPGMHGRWVRNIMMITFKPTATEADRQAVIDLVHGEVLGGNTWPMGEGEYIVRIPYATAPGDSVSGPVLRTFLVLRGHPSIMTAYPPSMDNLSKIQYR